MERKEDHKIVKLHPFEVASLANLIKAVSGVFLFIFYLFLFIYFFVEIIFFFFFLEIFFLVFIHLILYFSILFLYFPSFPSFSLLSPIGGDICGRSFRLDSLSIKIWWWRNIEGCQFSCRSERKSLWKYVNKKRSENQDFFFFFFREVILFWIMSFIRKFSYFGYFECDEW